MSSNIVSSQPVQMSTVGAVIKLGGTMPSLSPGVEIMQLYYWHNFCRTFNHFVSSTFEYFVELVEPQYNSFRPDIWCGCIMHILEGKLECWWIGFCTAHDRIFAKHCHWTYFRHHLRRQNVWQESSDKECRHVWRDAAGPVDIHYSPSVNILSLVNPNMTRQ